MIMGHRVHPKNHNEVVERIVSDLPFRIRAKKDLRYLLETEKHESYTTLDWNEQQFSLGKPFMVTRIALEETNFWGPGPLQGDLECKAVDTIVLADSDGTEHRMSASLLGGFDMGITRMNSYYVEHHIRSRFPKTRSEGNVSLKILPTTHECREKYLEKTRVCQLSVLRSELEPLKRDFPRAVRWFFILRANHRARWTVV